MSTNIETALEKSFGVTHVIANCLDCSWETANHKNGQAIAAIHAKKYHHLVSVEVAIAGTYNGRRAI